MYLLCNKLINLGLIIALSHFFLQHYKVGLISLLIASHLHQHVHLVAFARLN